MKSHRRIVGGLIVILLIGCQANRPIPWRAQRVAPWRPMPSMAPARPMLPPGQTVTRNPAGAATQPSPREKLVPTPLPDPQFKSSGPLSDEVTVHAAKPASPEPQPSTNGAPKVRFSPSPLGTTAEPDAVESLPAEPSVPRSAASPSESKLPSLALPQDSESVELPKSKTSPGPRLGFESLTAPAESGLVLEVKAPKRAPVGGSVTYDVEVRNDGSSEIQNAVVNVDFDDDLFFPGHNETRLTKTLGTIAAGQARQMRLTLMSPKPGPHVCQFELTAVNSATVTRKVSVEFRQQKLDLKLIGPPLRTVGSRAEFAVKIANVWTEPIKDLVVSLKHEATLSPVDASPGHKREGDALVWTFNQLAPGEGIQVLAEFDCRNPSEQACLTLTAQAADVHEETDACLSLIETPGTIDLKVTDRSEPTTVGGEVIFDIVVQNLDLQTLPGMRLDVKCSEQLRLESYVAEMNNQPVTLLKSEQQGHWTLAVNKAIPADASLRLTVRATALKFGDAELLVTATTGDDRSAIEMVEFTTINE